MCTNSITRFAIDSVCCLVVLLGVIFGCNSTSSVDQKVSSNFDQELTAKPLQLPASQPAAVKEAWVIGDRSEPAGYALRLRAESRSGYFTALVMLDSSFTIKEVDVEKYIGERGGEIRRGKFLQQFQDKRSRKGLYIGGDIDAVTGATISSKALTDAVRNSVRWFAAEAVGKGE